MRILFISDNKSNEDQYRNFLANIAEPDSIFFVYSFPSAIAFLKSRMIKKQESLDLIILKGGHYADREVSFDQFINSDISTTYSGYDFNLYKIPIVKILKQGSDFDKLHYQSYSNRYGGLDKELLVEYGDEIINSIKTWRRAVLDDMDTLGIRMNSGIVDYGKILAGERNYNGHTFILSENFRNMPRKLNYYWIITNLRQIEKGIDDYIKLLKVHSVKNKKAEELKIHRFFNNNVSFLERDRYSSTWYEPELRLGDAKSYEPDYTLKTNFNYTTDLSVIEVKLPNEGFLKTGDFHRTFFAKVFQHLTQIADYKDYLEDGLYNTELQGKFGFLPEKIDYNLLIGRDVDLEENQDLIRKRMKQFGQQHINLMTYDQLMHYQVAFLERLNLLEVR